jgi:predicted dehydrogenase
LVVVSVRAPAHAAAIRAALAAGKHVLSEWPLGVDLAEATDLAAAAERAGVLHAVGLQAFHSPSARFVRDLLAGGRIGRVDAVSMIVAGDPLGGARLPAGLAWSADAAAGNTVLTIMAGHALAAIEHVAGEFVELSAAVTYRDGVVDVAGEPVPNTAPSQVALVGLLAGGALGTLAVQGGSGPGPDGFVVRVAGTEGALTITPDDLGHYPGWATWRVRATAADGTATDLPLPDRYRTLPAGVPGGPAANVAAGYQQIARALAAGRPTRPSFTTAVRYHRLLAAIEQSSRTGARQRIAA